MKITLYENCIVNDRYNEVFHEQFFESYLSTLNSIELDIYDTYTTFNGRFVIQHILDNNKSIYKYNYMKVETDNDQFEGPGFTRYCFVDNIEIHNGYVTLDYSEDIWHSYSKGINIRNSYLTRSRQLQYGNRSIPVYRLPLPFGGNNLPVPVKRPFTGTKSGYSIVARLQTYELSSNGEPRKREAVFSVIGSKSVDIVISDITKTQVFDDINTLEETLTLFETLSADKNFKTTYVSSTEPADKYFEIDDIYVIPSQFIPNITESHNPIGSIVKEIASAPSTSDYIYEYYHCYKLVDFYSDTSNVMEDYAEVYSDTITWEGVDNFKNISVGILSNQVPLDNNGSDINFKILTGGSTYEFSILMLIQNKVIDVTNEFKIEIPFNSITGDVTAQRKIANYMQIMSGTINTTKGIAQLIAGLGYTPTSYSSSGAIVPYDYYNYLGNDDYYKDVTYYTPTKKDFLIHMAPFSSKLGLEFRTEPYVKVPNLLTGFDIYKRIKTNKGYEYVKEKSLLKFGDDENLTDEERNERHLIHSNSLLMFPELQYKMMLSNIFSNDSIFNEQERKDLLLEELIRYNKENKLFIWLNCS